MMTRRIFLKNGSLALVSLGFAPAFIARAAQAAEARKKILVAIFQRGAVDGLNMIVPFGEKRVLRQPPVDRHPAPRTSTMAPSTSTASSGCIRAWRRSRRSSQRGELAIVHACGSPDETRSHFDAQDYMESGTPGVKSTRDGWMNRYLHAKEHENAPARSAPWRWRRSCRGRSRAPSRRWPSASSRQFGVHAGAAPDDDGHVVRGAVRAGRRRAAASDRARGVRRGQAC